MSTGAWRYRHPLPVPPGRVVVQPIGVCTRAEAECYQAGRDAAEAAKLEAEGRAYRHGSWNGGA